MRACMRTTCGFHLRPEAPTHERKPTKMMSYEELVDFARPCIVHIRSDRGTGTGWIQQVDSDGDAWILTNEHVVSGCETVQVMHPDLKEPEDAKVRNSDKDHDLAVVLVRARPDWKGLAMLENTEAVKIGTEVIAIGVPLSGTTARRPERQPRDRVVECVPGGDEDLDCADRRRHQLWQQRWPAPEPRRPGRRDRDLQGEDDAGLRQSGLCCRAKDRPEFLVPAQRRATVA